MPEPQGFTLPSTVVQSIEDRDAIVAALEVFDWYIGEVLDIPGRDIDADTDLQIAAQRVLTRMMG